MIVWNKRFEGSSKKGFMDGIVGIKFNILQTLYYRLLVDCFIIVYLFVGNRKRKI